MKEPQTRPTPAPAAGSEFWLSPALKFRSPDYPERFQGRVPMRIRALWTVAGVETAGRSPTLFIGWTYEAWTDEHGAVSGISSEGILVPVQPSDFEVVEWHEPEPIETLETLRTCRDHWQTSWRHERDNVVRLRGLLRDLHGPSCVCRDCQLAGSPKP